MQIKQEAADQNKWLLVNVESSKMEFGSDMVHVLPICMFGLILVNPDVGHLGTQVTHV